MEHEDGYLLFNEREYGNVPGLRQEMPEADAQLALDALTRRLEGINNEIEEIGADPRSWYRGRWQELRGLQAVLGITRLQLAQVLDPNLSLETLAGADSEFVQAQLLKGLRRHLG